MSLNKLVDLTIMLERVAVGTGVEFFEAPSMAPAGYSDMSAGQNLFLVYDAEGKPSEDLICYFRFQGKFVGGFGIPPNEAIEETERRAVLFCEDLKQYAERNADAA